MSSKILIAVVAFVAGAGAVYGYNAVSANLAISENEKKEFQIATLEGRIDELSKKVEKLGMAHQNRELDTETLSTRVNDLNDLFSKLREKSETAEESQPETPGGAAGARETMPPASLSSGRLSGDELAEAMRDLPEEGRKAMRKVIAEEIRKMRENAVYRFETKDELLDKAKKSLKSVEQFLEMTPVQIEQFKDIVTRQIEGILEMQEVARERNDLAYAAKMRLELRMDAEKELVEMLTPEQMDKLREADPDGFGKRHPRGF